MKLLKKISAGSINGIRGGFRDIKGRERVMTLIGVAHDSKQHVNEKDGKVSWGFIGEFRAINRHGEEAVGPLAYIPEPMQSALQAQLKDSGASVEFGFHVFAVEDTTSVVGYVFECESLIEPKPSNAVAALASRLGVTLPSAGPALGHDKPTEVEAPAAVEPKKATSKK